MPVLFNRISWKNRISILSQDKKSSYCLLSTLLDKPLISILIWVLSKSFLIFPNSNQYNNYNIHIESISNGNLLWFWNSPALGPVQLTSGEAVEVPIANNNQPRLAIQSSIFPIPFSSNTSKNAGTLTEKILWAKIFRNPIIPEFPYEPP